MKIYAFLLLILSALTNAAITTYHKANSFQHNSPGKIHYKTISSTTGKDDKILRNDMQMKNDGSYHYQYETSNGITGMEKGLGGVSVQGANSYVSPEGVEIKMTYTADENGYHPVGEHIPKTPDYILRALEYIRTHPYKENTEYTKKQEFNKKAPVTQTHKIPTKIAPPTRKPTPRRQTPTTRTSNSFSRSNKYTGKIIYQQKKF